MLFAVKKKTVNSFGGFDSLGREATLETPVTADTPIAPSVQKVAQVAPATSAATPLEKKDRVQDASDNTDIAQTDYWATVAKIKAQEERDEYNRSKNTKGDTFSREQYALNNPAKEPAPPSSDQEKANTEAPEISNSTVVNQLTNNSGNTTNSSV